MLHHKKGVFASLLLILLLATGYSGWALLRPLPAMLPQHSLASVSQASKAVTLPWPAYGEAAIGTAGYRVVASSGDQKPLPTASIAKVLTALLVLRQHPLALNDSGPTITITQADVDTYNSYVAKDGSVAKVSVGEQISEYQALQALLLSSANNFADTLARWAFGSVTNYNSYANDFVKNLGLSSITITDPSGFSPSTVGSAKDLVVLGELAMLNPVLAQIVAQPSAVIPVEGTIRNYNSLLGKNGTIGIKTGNNDQDKGAYLFASNQTVDGSDVTIIGTIMGGPDLGTVLHDSLSLSQVAADHFSYRTFAHAGQTIASYDIPGQGSANATITQDLSVLVWDGSRTSFDVSLQPLGDNAKAGQKVGTATVTNNLNHVGTSQDIVLHQAVKPPSWQWRLKHPF